MRGASTQRAFGPPHTASEGKAAERLRASEGLYDDNASVRPPHNPKVAGSNPAPATNLDSIEAAGNSGFSVSGWFVLTSADTRTVRRRMLPTCWLLMSTC